MSESKKKCSVPRKASSHTDIRLGKKAQSIIDNLNMSQNNRERLENIFSSYKLEDSRYKRNIMRYESIKELLKNLYAWTCSIEDEYEKKCAQINAGLIVYNKYYFIIWVERFKASVGSHSTINNLLNHIGCVTVNQDIDTRVKHETVLCDFLSINRNWSVRLCSGLFDEFFLTNEIEKECKPDDFINLDVMYKKPKKKKGEQTIKLCYSPEEDYPSLLDTNFSFNKIDPIFDEDRTADERQEFEAIIEL